MKQIISAEHLKIHTNEMGMGWEEVAYQKISDPNIFFEDYINKINGIKNNNFLERHSMKKLEVTARIQKSAKKDEIRILEIKNKLTDCNVKDCSILQAEKKGYKTHVFMEIDSIVFDSINDASNFFTYINKKKVKTEVVGDEVTVISEEQNDFHKYCIQVSNAFIQIIIFNDAEEAKSAYQKIIKYIQQQT